MNKSRTSPVQLTLSLIAAVVFVWIPVGDQSGTMAAQSIFTGPAPSVLNSDDVDVLPLRFEAGARSHWHSHSQGQLLLVEEGRGRAQVRGEPVRENAARRTRLRRPACRTLARSGPRPEHDPDDETQRQGRVDGGGER